MDEDDTGTEKPVGTLTLGITGLEDLGDNFVYEGWILVDGNPVPVSTGTFTVDAKKELSKTEFEIASDALEKATIFVLSIEPSDDKDPAPSASKLLAGNFTADSAKVAPTTLLKDPSKLVESLATLGGKFFLKTPTDDTEGMPSAPNNNNDENGIWFGTPGMPPTPGLSLPTLASGWVYEGWVVIPATESTPAIPLTTGTFTEFNKPDSGNPFSGTENNVGPPVPGEDFLLNAPTGVAFPLDVRGKTIVISIEPKPDNSPGPFLLKPLVREEVPATAQSGDTFSFTKKLGSLPSGTVVRSGN